MREIFLLLFALVLTTISNAQTDVVAANNVSNVSAKSKRETDLGIYKLIVRVSVKGGQEIELPVYEKENITAVKSFDYAHKVMDEIKNNGLEVVGFSGSWISYNELELEKKKERDNAE